MFFSKDTNIKTISGQFVKLGIFLSTFKIMVLLMLEEVLLRGRKPALFFHSIDFFYSQYALNMRFLLLNNVDHKQHWISMQLIVHSFVLMKVI